MDMTLLNHFLALAKRQFRTGDFDAEHPLYLHLIKSKKIPYEQGLWLSFLYMAFYDEASAWVTFNSSDPFTIPKNVALPIGTNRRNLYGGKIIDHFTALRAARKSANSWPTHNFVGDPIEDWERLKQNIGSIWGNGRFATFTTAEMIQKVNGANVTITGFDNDGSSAPADGIQRLYKCDRKSLTELDKFGEDMFNRIVKLKWHPFYTETDRGVVESVLCNFSAMCRGRFYSGRNLDRQQQRILKVEKLTHKELNDLWIARETVFEHDFLGECRGWVGINKPRLNHYCETKEVLWANENRF